MVEPGKISDWSRAASLQTQTEVLDIPRKKSQLFIGVPNDARYNENRVSLVPSAVATLCAEGHRVRIEQGAGYQANFTDHQYSEAGAEIIESKKDVFESHIILKTSPLNPEELDLLRMNQVLIAPLTIPLAKEEHLLALKNKKIIAIATEYLRDADDSFPLVRGMSEIAGISIISTACELLSSSSSGIGKLLGGISGVPPAKVVILGAGIVAEYACRAALGMGASVHVYDNNTYKLHRLQNIIGRQIHTSSINNIELAEDLSTADVAIGAVHSTLGRAPIIVSEEMVMNMPAGSIIIDVSIDQGGCFESSQVTSHDRPTFRRHGVLHYCVPNITSRFPRTASRAISNILLTMLQQAEKKGGMEQLIANSRGLRHGVYTYRGCLTNKYLSKRFNLKYTDLELIIPNNY